jgi:hypothetical protein
MKEEIANVLIRRVEEQVAPGLRSHILFYDVATPITHYRYTGNKNGTMMGARPGKENMQAKVAHYQNACETSYFKRTLGRIRWWSSNCCEGRF